MFVGALAGLSLIVSVSIDSATSLRPEATPQLSERAKSAAMRPLVKDATECIARRVAADPRFAASHRAGNVTDLIVDSIPPCLDAVRALIDGHDRYYGSGTGETFFMGPYLDALPAAVNELVETRQK
jgi:hypothetical protein